MKMKLIACETLKSELELCVASSPHEIDAQYVTVGLHSAGKIKMPLELQALIDDVPDGYDAILLGYALCSYGIVGLHAPVPLVVPRGHDCITLFMGSKEVYREYFDSHPGTFFFTNGFYGHREMEDDDGDEPRRRMREELVEKYGEEDADYVMGIMGGWQNHYKRYTFVNTGNGPVEEIRSHAMSRAQENNWLFEEMEGTSSLLERLTAGDWNSAEFLVVQPGETIKPSFGEDIICPVLMNRD